LLHLVKGNYFSCVKNKIAIFLMSAYVFSATELHELAKLPILVFHFLEHQQDNPEITFTDFLSLHYTSYSEHKNKKTEDEKLPFKSHSEMTGWFLHISIPSKPHDFSFHFSEHSVNYQIFSNFLLPTSILSSIWQPPKLG
jgi:hypothetical protein